MIIGIDDSYGLVYEGSGGDTHGGRPILPTPIVTPAAFFSEKSDSLILPRSSSVRDVECWFREDHFDPVSRLRRGRFYSRHEGGTSNPMWRVIPLPSLRVPQGMEVDGLIKKQLWSYAALSLRSAHSIYKDMTLVSLGVEGISSVWNIVSVEAISTGEEMVTLKARQSFGALPEIHWNSVPESFREKVRETINTLLDDVHRAGPESVIDRCRDAASAILRAHLGEEHAGDDFGALIKTLANQTGENKKRIVISASEIIRVFHPRAKPNEQERRQLRAVREQDAELSVQCVGTILCELGWADWNG